METPDFEHKKGYFKQFGAKRVKGEIAQYKQLLLLSQPFKMLSTSDALKGVHHVENSLNNRMTR